MRIFGLNITRAESGVFKSPRFTGMSLDARVREAVFVLEECCPGDPAGTKKAIMEKTETIVDKALHDIKNGAKR